MATVTVQADDFSGAAEVGQQFSDHGFSVRIMLATTAAPSRGVSLTDGADVLVLDTHSRGMSAAAAAHAVAQALGGVGIGQPSVHFKKTDSLWRGNLAAELSVLTGLGHHVVLAGAFPAMERTVIDGKPFAAGLPLSSTALWHVESARAPEHLSELFSAGTDVRFVGLGDVRSADLAQRLAAALRASGPAIVVVDGETEGDLAAVVGALEVLGFAAGERPVALAGTGQLAGLLARHLAHNTAHNTQAAAAPARPGGSSGVLAVVGSASPAARRQVVHLAAEGFDVVGIGAGGEGPYPAHVRAALAEGRSVALTVADGPIDPSRSAAIVTRLASMAREALRGVPADLILTGGETAREVLDALAISSLVPLAAVQRGAVVSLADDGRLVATKPGSFGDPLVLAQLYRALTAHASTPRAGPPAC